MPYLYAVRMNIFGYPFHPVKIGRSVKPVERAKAYSGGPFPTTWLGSWEVENAEVEERQLHRRFENYRLGGEWFYPSVSLVAFVERKIHLPIEAILSCPPSRKHSEFQHRFVRLFPYGIASIEQEWVKPGRAKPCSDRAMVAAQQRLDALERLNPLFDTPVFDDYKKERNELKNEN